MAGLLDPQIMQLLSGGNPGTSPGGGLLAASQPKPGLLGVFDSDEGRLGMSLLAAASPMSRPMGFGERLVMGLDTYDRMGQRDARRQHTQLETLKTGFELQKLHDDRKRQQAINQGLQQLEQEDGGARQSAAITPQLDSAPADEYGTAGIGGVPMFSAGGAARFGSQPIGAYTPPQPQTSMPTARTQPASFTVGNGGGVPGVPAPSGVGHSPGAFNAGGPAGTADYQRLIRQARVYERAGDMKTATDLLTLADRFRPEFATDFRQVMDPATGQLINVMVSKDGRVTPVPYGVKPDIQLQELGGHVAAIDKNNTRGGATWQKSPTHADRISAGNLSVSQQRLGLDRERLVFEQNQPTYMQTNEGLVALPKRPAPGAQITGQPITGPNGESLGNPLKPIPQGVNDAILTNQRALDQIDRAIALMEGRNVGDPARGGMQGDANATGWKGYLPDAVLNRLDPTGVDARAEISDIGSLKIHERSGAASTVSEMKRIQPFIPSAIDTQESALKKLRRLRLEVEAEANGLSSIYSKEQGYRPSPIAQRRQGDTAGAVQAQALPPSPSFKNLQKDAVYELPNGKRARWDGLQFKVVKQ